MPLLSDTLGVPVHSDIARVPSPATETLADDEVADVLAEKFLLAFDSILKLNYGIIRYFETQHWLFTGIKTLLDVLWTE